MIQEKRIVALIPARGGSKGIPDKNIRDIKGKPLIAYTIEAARNSQYIDEVIVSTDSERIRQVAMQYQASAPFLRPETLATDTAKTIDVVLHTIEYLHGKEEDYDYLVLLQPTSPLRTQRDIDGAIEKFMECGEQGLASVSQVSDSPILIRKIDEKTNRMENLMETSSTIRRQDMPDYYRINGGIYINRVADISPTTSFNDNKVFYIMSKQHSVDVDEYIDLEIVKYYLEKGETNEDTLCGLE